MTSIILFASDATSFQGWASILQVVISAVTGYFLIETFRLQAATFEQQRKVTEMESLNYRIKLVPDIEVVGKNDVASIDEFENGIFITQIVFQVKKNNLTNLVIGYKVTGEGVYTVHYQEHDKNKTWLDGERFSISIRGSYEDIQGYNYDPDLIPYIYFGFRFKDLLGTEYVQYVKFQGANQITTHPKSYYIKKAAHL